MNAPGQASTRRIPAVRTPGVQIPGVQIPGVQIPGVQIPGVRISCVGAVLHDGQGRLLLVRRANPPAAGTWSLPGGRVEPGESDAAAVVREVAEETGLAVTPGRLVGAVERAAPGGGVYVIRDLACALVGGQLAAGDDATDARWCAAGDLERLPLAPGLVEALTAWGVMPR